MADQLPGICWDAATRLYGCAKVHVAYAFKLKKNLTPLQSKLVELENISKDVEAKVLEAESIVDMKRTNEVDGWLHQVQNLQLIIKDIEAKGSQEIHNACISGCCQKNLVSSYKIGKKIVEKTVEVDELLTSGKRFLDKNVDIARKLPPTLVDEMPTGETVGLELMLKKVWNSLKDETVGIIGLHGMGGAGKTTLMKRIHNELGNKEHEFERVFWVVVSKDCNEGKVMNDIRNGIGIPNDFWDRSNNDQRAAKINQILKQKRFVLMLDDLWRKLELEKVGVPHPKETNFRSKVVLTTRSEDVCDKMQANKKYKVECLLEKEAFDLFCKKVGEETLNCSREILKLAGELAKECRGLPLALITVGSAMGGVKSVESWRLAEKDLKSCSLIGPDLEEKVFIVLKFSYDRLPDEVHKNCFLYCALYPEDYPIQVESLVDRWIGEGFLGKGKNKMSIYEMRDEGLSVIAKLKLSSLVEDATDMNTWGHWEPKIKMHDVIRDMALWLARDRDENKDKVVVQMEAFEMDSRKCNAVERISVISVKEEEEEVWEWQLPICPNLITLCAQGSQITQLLNLHHTRRLKVLDLYHSFSYDRMYLPAEIGKLINLEFLNLSFVQGIHELPIEVKNLSKLRVFLVENVMQIPLEVFEGLRRLQVLRLGEYEMTRAEEREEILLDKLESLPDLEELGLCLKTVSRLQKLHESNKLQSCVRVLALRKMKDFEMTWLLASLSTMKHLKSLELYGLGGIMEVSSITHTCRLHKLRQLRIHQCHSITHLTWLRYAPFLESLIVTNCESVEEVVKGAQDDDDDDDDVGMNSLFSNLKTLNLQFLRKLKSIHKRALPFPSLNSIFVQGCDNLRKLPLNSNSAKDTLIQIRGYTYWWKNLEWEDSATKDLFRAKFQPFDHAEY